MKNKINIYEILFWIFFIIAIIMILWYIFGDSPTIEQTLLVLIITFLFKIQADVFSNSSEMRIMKDSFIRLVRDFKEQVKYGEN